MTVVKRYLAILIIACFTVATTGTMVMAHCDHSAMGHSSPELQKKMDGCSHSHAMEEKKHDNHDNHKSADETEDNMHGSDSTDTSGAEQTSCVDCTTGLCKNQLVVHADDAPTITTTTSNYHGEKDLHLKSIFLTIIPDPPNTVS